MIGTDVVPTHAASQPMCSLSTSGLRKFSIAPERLETAPEVEKFWHVAAQLVSRNFLHAGCNPSSLEGSTEIHYRRNFT